jgi:hypothetical protein
MTTAELIEHLRRPESYPRPVDDVVVHQTHISVVFLAGDRAYKIKKPVDFGFVDYSTLERRRMFCRREVDLNRRLAPGVYRGVVPITEGSDTGLVVDGDGPAVEWAVEMERLPPEKNLESRLDGPRGGASGEEMRDKLERVAARLADFYETAATSPDIAEYASPEAVSTNMLDNFRDSRDQIGACVTESVFERFESLTTSELERLRGHIARRAREGVVRDTHGDLRLEHVYFLEEADGSERLSIIDCVEFNDAFRYADPIADMAFLAMDLEAHGYRDLARSFEATFFDRFDGPDPGGLVDLYVAYRAAVRAKVSGLKALEDEVGEEDRREARRKARRHWMVGLGRLEEARRRPALILVGGLPGTGKSTLARGLAEEGNFDVIDTDVVRKELAGLEPGASAEADVGSGIYSREWSDRTYDSCLERARARLFEGERVIVDGSFREADRRLPFFERAVEWGVPCRFLVCEAPEEVVLQRLRAREGDASDAGVEVYRSMKQTWEPVEGFEARRRARIQTDGSPEASVASAVETLRRWELA